MSELGKRILSALKAVALFGVAMLVVFTLIEGLASVALFSYGAIFNPERGLGSRAHVEFDDRLGWINIPGLELPDMYGPGVGLRINAQSFRNDEVFQEKIPAGRVRVICSGDSFTLGLGVSNEDNWCQGLGAREARIQPVNLGEAGYGLGQIYLKYELLGEPLDHDVHIVAFIDDSFRRMRLKDFLGYAKPTPRLRDGELVIENIPVPETSYRLTWVTHNAALLGDLRSVQFGRKVLGKLAPRKPAEGMSPQESRDAALIFFERLREKNLRKNSTLVLLLQEQSQWGIGQREELSSYLTHELGLRGFHFIDAASVFRELPPEELAAMYDEQWGHYSVLGNARIADLVHERLLEIPEIAAKLAAAD